MRTSHSSTRACSAALCSSTVRSGCSTVSLGSTIPKDETMDSEPLRIGAVAKLLDVPSRQIVQLIYDRRVPYVMHEGIAHVPPDALDEYRAALHGPAA